MPLKALFLVGNASGQMGISSASWEKIWDRKPDPVLYREKVLSGLRILVNCSQAVGQDQ